MANIKSAKKRAKTNKKRYTHNLARRSEIKTLTKKVLAAIDANDSSAAKDLLKNIEAKLARAKGKRVVKKATVARKVSRLSKQIKKIEQAGAVRVG